METTALPSSISAPATTSPQPPARWSRWWTSPIARFDYTRGSTMQAWREAWIPANRNFAGDLRPDVTYGGTSRDEAIAAARALAAVPVKLRIDVAGGHTRTITINPAIAVLHDARRGAYWLAPLRTTVQSGGKWIEAPHSIDGAAFEGKAPVLKGASVLSATRDMVAIVGRDTVITPSEWSDAPDDSKLR